MFAVAAIAKGERLIEYKGQRRTHDEVDAGAVSYTHLDVYKRQGQ